MMMQVALYSTQTVKIIRIFIHMTAQKEYVKKQMVVGQINSLLVFIMMAANMGKAS
ncbi:hypothetical protein D3C76_1794080 [compost metagenome]